MLLRLAEYAGGFEDKHDIQKIERIIVTWKSQIPTMVRMKSLPRCLVPCHQQRLQRNGRPTVLRGGRSSGSFRMRAMLAPTATLGSIRSPLPSASGVGPIPSSSARTAPSSPATVAFLVLASYG